MMKQHVDRQEKGDRTVVWYALVDKEAGRAVVWNYARLEGPAAERARELATQYPLAAEDEHDDGDGGWLQGQWIGYHSRVALREGDTPDRVHKEPRIRQREDAPADAPPWERWEFPDRSDDCPLYDCEFIGAPCYNDGSSLASERLVTMLVKQGPEAVWAELRDYYDRTFAT